MEGSNTPTRYGLIVVFLHWLTVVIIAVTALAIEIPSLVPGSSSLQRALEDWHIYLGFVLLPIVIIRLIHVRRKTAPPINPPLSRWQLALTRWMKWWLYAFLIGMPLSGWIFLSADGAMINVWAIPMPDISPESEQLASLARQIHVLLGLAGYGLIAIHVSAALFQHYVARNDTLRRMLPRFLLRKQ